MSISPDRILFEDEHLLIVNKLSGELVVEGGKRGREGSSFAKATEDKKEGKLPLLNFLKKDYPGLRTIHRLDFETSGAVVFARTKEAYEQIMSSKFSSWRKAYRTIVVGRLKRKSGVIDSPLPARGKGTVDAVTRYRVLEEFANSSYVECEIETGRHHQIRRHFAGIKHPLVLDHVYGHKRFNNVFTQEFRLRKFFLHAFSIEFPHPITGKRISVEAPMPKAFVEILKKLKIRK